jgi:glycosyltransferase involved in cell wall biosynthesis
VIDGGSTDGTVDVLRRLGDRIDYWDSAADQGIYDAMNRGIDVSRAQWLYFMGADDAFFDRHTLDDVMRRAAGGGDADLIFGRVLMGKQERLFTSRFDNRLYLRNTIHHQSAFYNRKVFEKFRYGHEKGRRFHPFRISGDYQLNLELFAQKRPAHFVDRVIARCADGSSQQGRLIGYLEEIVIRHRHMPFAPAALCDILTVARYLLKKFTRYIR